MPGKKKEKVNLILIISLITILVLGIGGCVGCFYWGRNGGWKDGYNTGKEDGYNEGFEKGREWGYELGKQDEEAYEKAYSAGKFDMYNFMHSWYNSHGILP
ncbi:MAG: hypothetical protein PUC03_05245 [Clostridiales bacterium]|nr:hypothetical protein [Clostridiales bacterium]